MPVRSIFQWRLILENLQPWNAAEFLLRDLHDYPVFRGAWNPAVERDLQQLENFLLAYASMSHSKRSNKVSGPVPVLSGDLTVADWRSIFGKLSLAAAAEALVANYLFDAKCDYGYAVTVIKRALQAWSELELEAHGLIGIGTSIAPEPSPNNAA